MAAINPKPLFPLLPDEIKRFWSHVSTAGPDDCWPWTRGKTEDGYGRFMVQRVEFHSHRMAYFLATGDDPGPLLVCHSCDFPSCCNPKHLRKDTQLANIAERNAKGRTATGYKSGVYTHPEKIQRGDAHFRRRCPELVYRGEKHGMAILTEQQVREILLTYKPDVNGMCFGFKKRYGPDFASRYGVTKATIYHIVRRMIWKHVKPV